MATPNDFPFPHQPCGRLVMDVSSTTVSRPYHICEVRYFNPGQKGKR